MLMLLTLTHLWSWSEAFVAEWFPRALSIEQPGTSTWLLTKSWANTRTLIRLWYHRNTFITNNFVIGVVSHLLEPLFVLHLLCRIHRDLTHLLGRVCSEHLILWRWDHSRLSFFIFTLDYFRWRYSATFGWNLHFFIELYWHSFRLTVVLYQIFQVFILSHYATTFTRIIESLALRLSLVLTLAE